MTIPHDDFKKIIFLRPIDLHIDPEVQRRYDDNLSNKIARKFDRNLLGLLLVSRREDGFLYTIDGQHRRRAAMKVGLGNEAVLPCVVEEGLSRADEAQLFVAWNTMAKRPSPIDVFRVRVIAQDKVAVEVNDILTAAGLEVGLDGRDGVVSAIVAVENVYMGRGGPRPGVPDPNVLIETLATLLDAWGKSRDAYDGVILRGLGLVLARHGNSIDMDRLAHALAKSGTPAQLVGRAKTLAGAYGIQQAKAAARTIIGIYNRGLRSNRLDENGL